MPSQPMSYEISLRDILRIIFKKKMIIATVFLMSLAGAFLYLNMTVPSYMASAKILISSAHKTVDPNNTELDAIRRAQPNVTQSEMVKGGAILDEVVRGLQLDQRTDKEEFYPRLKKVLQPVLDKTLEIIKRTAQSLKAIFFGHKPSEAGFSAFDEAVEELRGNINVDQVEDSDVFYFNVYDYNPVMAQRIAKAIARQYIVYDLRQQILNLSTRYGQDHPKVLQLKDAIESLNNAGEDVDLQNTNASGLATVKVVESPKVPSKPSKPRARIIYIACMLAGLIGGISLAFLTIAIDNTVKNPWEFEDLTGIPIISSIPRKRDITGRPGHLVEDIVKKGVYQSAYRRVTDHLYVLIREKHVKAITVADLNDSDNSAVNAFNLAYLFANSYNLRTVLLDADFRSPHLAAVLPVKDQGALTEILTGKSTLEKSKVASLDKLDILTVGTNDFNPLIFLMGQEMNGLLGELKAKYDIVIMNAPAFIDCHDPYIISQQTDGILLSLREDEVKRDIAVNILGSIRKEGRKIYGVVFNDRSYPIPGPIYRSV